MAPRKASEWFRPLIESTSEPITVVSVGSGRFVAINSAFYRNTGFQREELISKTPTEIGFLDDLAAYDRLLSGRSLQDDLNELQFRTREGKSRLAQVTRVAIEVAGQACLILIWRDITERRQFESDLLLARDLALESAQLKTDFLSNISHELRTPLNGIIGMSQLLADTELTSEQREYADTIERSSEILLKLVSKIPDFSAASNGQLRFQQIRFNLGDVIQTSVSLQTAVAKGKGLELISLIDPTIPSHLVGDPYRLSDVLANLLDNAFKFTHSGGVQVRVVAEELGDDSAVLRFEVHDTGIGISPADRKRVFQPFVQADGSTTRKSGGTGLGLAICTRLVNSMGGEIGVHGADDGCGSVFYFTARFALARTDSAQTDAAVGEDLPRVAVISPEQPVSAEPAAQLEKTHQRVLIVEDNVVNQMVMRRQLQKLGYKDVSIVENGLEALELLAKAPHDIVLMDCQMPVMDGVEATLRIRQKEKGEKRTTIIAVTGKAMPEDRERYLACGMDDYLSKPIRLDELAAVLERRRVRLGGGSNGQTKDHEDGRLVRSPSSS